MNRSLRLVRPSALSRPITASPLTRSSFLSNKSAFAAAPTQKAALPAIALPRQLGIRLYVTPSAAVFADNSKSKGKTTSGGTKEQKEADAKKGMPILDRIDVTLERSAVGNALAEARNVVGDLASIISGGQAPPAPTAFSGTAGAVIPGDTHGGAMAAMETSSHSHGGNVKEDFVSVTTGLIQSVPRHVLLFGLAGTLPYLGTAFGTVFLAREANLTGNGYSSLLNLNYDTALEALHTLEAVQITYGAVILSFLGALHWGMEFVGYGGEQGYRRLMIGTAPLLLAWPSTFMSHGIALGVQWIGFTLTWFLDQRATGNGWTPPWFATYRFYLSIIVGFSIIGTLAGTSYYEEGAGSAFADDKDARLAKSPKGGKGSGTAPNRRDFSTRKGPGPAGPLRGKVGGDISIVEEEGLEAYGRLRNSTKAADDEEEEEEEEEGEGEEEEGVGEKKGEAQDEDQEKENTEDDGGEGKLAAFKPSGKFGEGEDRSALK